MRQRLVKRCRRFLLKRLVAKALPESFHFDDPQNDYVGIERRTKRNVGVSIRRIEGDKVVYRLWTNGHHREESMPIDAVLAEPMIIRVYKGSLAVRTQSLWEAFRYSYLGAFRAVRRRQRRYDESVRYHRSRIEILNAAVRLRERFLRDGGPSNCNVFNVTKELYGPMIANSKRSREIVEHVGVNLLSFVDSGEIRVEGQDDRLHDFTVTPKAYATLSDYSIEERRHEHGIKVQNRLVFVTVVLTLVSIVQLITVLTSR